MWCLSTQLGNDAPSDRRKGTRDNQKFHFFLRAQHVWTIISLTSCGPSKLFLFAFVILLFGLRHRAAWVLVVMYRKMHTKVQVTDCPSNGMQSKRERAGNKQRQRRGLLVFSEQPNHSSAGSRSDWSRTSLGCKQRSLMRVALGWFDYPKKCEEGQSNSGLYASKRSKTPHGVCISPLSAKSAGTNALS
jgi:hypothetical protein